MGECLSIVWAAMQDSGTGPLVSLPAYIKKPATPSSGNSSKYLTLMKKPSKTVFAVGYLKFLTLNCSFLSGWTSIWWHITFARVVDSRHTTSLCTTRQTSLQTICKGIHNYWASFWLEVHIEICWFNIPAAKEQYFWKVFIVVQWRKALAVINNTQKGNIHLVRIWYGIIIQTKMVPYCVLMHFYISLFLDNIISVSQTCTSLYPPVFRSVRVRLECCRLFDQC